jgi:hypothetical protein
MRHYSGISGSDDASPQLAISDRPEKRFGANLLPARSPPEPKFKAYADWTRQVVILHASPANSYIFVCGRCRLRCD